MCTPAIEFSADTAVKVEGSLAWYDSEQRTKTAPEDRLFIWHFHDGLNKFFTLDETPEEEAEDDAAWDRAVKNTVFEEEK